MTVDGSNHKTFITGVSFALLNAVSLGLLGVIDKKGATDYDVSLLFSLHSVVIGAIFASIFGILYRRNKLLADFRKTPRSSWFAIAMFGIFASGLFILFRFLGLTQSTGTFATLGQVITTSLTAVFAYIILKERLSKQFWIFFTFVILATYVVSTDTLSFSVPKTGDLLIVLAAFFLAIANIFAKIAIKKTTPIVLSVGRFYIGALFLLLTTLLIFGSSIPFSYFSYWSIASGLFWAINILAFSFAIARIDITLATSILMLGPIITMILEINLLGQYFSPLQIAAALVVIISGIAMLVTTYMSKIRPTAGD